MWLFSSFYFSAENFRLSIHSISLWKILSYLYSELSKGWNLIIFSLDNWSCFPSSLHMKCCWIVSWTLFMLCYVDFVSYCNLLNNVVFSVFRQWNQLDSDCISVSLVGDGSDLLSVCKAFAELLGICPKHVPLRGSLVWDLGAAFSLSSVL